MSDGLAITALAVSGISALGTVWGVTVSRRANSLSTQALAWQQRRGQERSTPRVEIEFDHASETRPMYVNGLADPRPYPLYYKLTVSVVNRGETTEHVKSLRVENKFEDVDLTEWRDGEDQELKPRSRIAVDTDGQKIPEWHRGFVAVATLAGGQVIRSDDEHLKRDLVEHIEEHNRRAQP